MENKIINKHFKNESKIMLWLLIAPMLLGVLFALMFLNFSTQMDIDSCLDSGGSYNYEDCTCDHEKNHVYQENHQCN